MWWSEQASPDMMLPFHDSYWATKKLLAVGMWWIEHCRLPIALLNKGNPLSKHFCRNKSSRIIEQTLYDTFCSCCRGFWPKQQCSSEYWQGRWPRGRRQSTWLAFSSVQEKWERFDCRWSQAKPHSTLSSQSWHASCLCTCSYPSMRCCCHWKPTEESMCTSQVQRLCLSSMLQASWYHNLTRPRHQHCM